MRSLPMIRSNVPSSSLTLDQIVQPQVLIEELGNHWVIVADGDITTAPMHHQAGQCKAGAHFEDALPRKVHRQHGAREDLARWPDLAE
jgi:hypothetical protein